MIEQIAYTKAVSYHINNPGLEKWRADMWFMDDCWHTFNYDNRVFDYI